MIWYFQHKYDVPFTSDGYYARKNRFVVFLMMYMMKISKTPWIKGWVERESCQTDVILGGGLRLSCRCRFCPQWLKEWVLDAMDGPTPSSSSPSRLRRPSIWVNRRTTSPSVSCSVSSLFLLSRWTPHISFVSKNSAESRTTQVLPLRIRQLIR